MESLGGLGDSRVVDQVESGCLHPEFPFCSLPQASSPCGVGQEWGLGVGWRRWGGGLLGC